MIIPQSVKIKNYKCFGETEIGFEKIYPINIIIGKNNSGKSSLIDLIEFLIQSDRNLLRTDISKARCIVTLSLTDELIERVAKHYATAQRRNPLSWITLVKQHVNALTSKEVKFEFNGRDKINLISNENLYGQYKDSFINIFSSHFGLNSFKRINAERDIVQEIFNQREDVDRNGKGATNEIWKYLLIKGYDQNVIKKDFLNSLNRITNPDIEFVDIIIKEENIENRQAANGEIYFENPDGQWVALSKMGSGIKTIILVLLYLIVIPKRPREQTAKLVFGFEELENNLHPSLQRRLFNYIANYAIENNCYFFLTTHSNIPIDLFSSKEYAQIIHVFKQGSYSFAKTVETHFDGKYILKDLDYRPSDILLSNGIIWVEGPSDAIYLELFLDLYKTAKAEDLAKFNYTIQALSTAIWKYAGFTDFNWNKINEGLQNQIISLEKLNHNHLLIIDNDGNYDNNLPRNWESFTNGIGKNKAKLIFESLKYASHDEANLASNYGDTKDSKLFFLVNDGTVETYMKHFILNAGKDFSKYFDLEEKRGYFEKKREGKDSSISKVELAAEIASFSLDNNLTFLDFAPIGSSLADKVKKLFNTIKSWN